MKYKFNFENREKPIQFNREKLLLSALQEPEQLYYMLNTQYEGIYQAEAVERRRLYGTNSFKAVLDASNFKFLQNRKEDIRGVFQQLYHQQIAVFRRGMHFYSETSLEDIVPGDVLFISRGDIVPADIRIIFSKDLEVDQTIYSDEETAVSKGSNYESDNLVLDKLTDLPNVCFVGSKVKEGLARGVVVSTGRATYLCHLLLM